MVVVLVAVAFNDVVVLVGPRNLPLKFGQNQVSKRRKYCCCSA